MAQAFCQADVNVGEQQRTSRHLGIGDGGLFVFHGLAQLLDHRLQRRTGLARQRRFAQHAGLDRTARSDRISGHFDRGLDH